MRKIVVGAACFLAFHVATGAQDNSPVAVIGFRWERVRILGNKISDGSVPPVRSVIPENKYLQRTARENRPSGSVDPNEYTTDGRAAALERSVQEARSVKADDVNGFRYVVNVRNDADRKLDVLFLEFRFTELSDRNRVLRRQLLCSVRLKNGEKMELSAFSLLGPSDVINADVGGEAKLDEKVLVNRMEFADGAVLQRQNWNFAEIKEAVERATATPWGKDTCRVLQ